MNTNNPLLLPALRAKFGDWWYYVTTMTFAQVADAIQPVNSIHEKKELTTWIQREIKQERKQEIADYLTKQPQRFFNAIVVGIYGGGPEWFPVTVGSSPNLSEIEVAERERTAFGLLRLSGSEDVFAIDGQHRVEGIKTALNNKPDLATEEQCVIFVAHHTTPDGRERTRRLFSTLNKYAKPVSKAELIALSEDDSFAIATRRFIEEYEGLSAEFVPFTKAAAIPSGDNVSVTTVVALYDLVREISFPPGSKERKAAEVGPPQADKVEAIYRQSAEFWDALKANIPEIRKICASKPEDKLVAHYRTPLGGHVLLRPAGMHAFVRATRIMVDRGAKISEAVEKLSIAPMQLSDAPWKDVLWKASTSTMLVKHGKLATNIFLDYAGETPEKRYDLLSIYRKVVEDPTAKLSLAGQYSKKK
jgi:DNA sulfur modification protein DndB